MNRNLLALYEQCLIQSGMHAAMGQEFDALMENGTWSLCPRPHNKHMVRNKWVYKIKRKQNDRMKRFKVRLVAKGVELTIMTLFHQ